MAKQKALFLDRDGIFNEPVFRDGNMHSPRNWDEVRHYPGLEGLADLKPLGFKLILVTNQPDIERGIIPATFVDELNRFYQNQFGLDGVYCCPFSSNEHPDKKPNPGMFLKAAKDFSLDLSCCFHLGDTERDVDAAKRCACRSILWDRPYNKGLQADFRINSLLELRSLLNLHKN